MRKIIILVALTLLAACDTGPSLQTRMASYTGATTETLIKTFGVPDKQITVNGVQYLAYDEHHLDITPGSQTFGGFYGGPFYGGGFYGGPIFASGIGPQIDERKCETTFELHHGKVFNFTLRGNDCS